MRAASSRTAATSALSPPEPGMTPQPGQTAWDSFSSSTSAPHSRQRMANTPPSVYAGRDDGYKSLGNGAAGPAAMTRERLWWIAQKGS